MQFSSPKNKVFVVVRDGECEEGSIWEAIMVATHYLLWDLIVIMDCYHTTEDLGILGAFPYLTVLNPASPLVARKAINHLDSDSIAKEIWNVYQRATQ